MINAPSINNNPTKAGNNLFTGNNKFTGNNTFNQKILRTNVTLNSSLSGFSITDSTNGSSINIIGYNTGSSIIGRFLVYNRTTDTNEYLDIQVNNNGSVEVKGTDNVKSSIVDLGIPNYNAGITTGYNTSFTPTSNGLGCWSFRGNYARITIRKGSTDTSSIIISMGSDQNTQNNRAGLTLPLKKGETYYIEFENTIKEVFAQSFYPCIGG